MESEIIEMNFLPIRKLYHCDELYAYPEVAIQNAVKRIGKLPNTLIEYYRQLGTNDEINQIQNQLYAPNALKLEDGYLTFYIEEQESMWWAIKETDLGYDDPPVYVCIWRDGKYTYLLESESLTKFLYAMAYFNATISLPLNSEGPFTCDSARKARLENHYKRRDFSLLQSSLTTFYGNDDDEVIMLWEDDDSCQVSFACTTEKQFNTIIEILSINGTNN